MHDEEFNVTEIIVTSNEIFSINFAGKWKKSLTEITLFNVTCLRYWQGNGLAIHRSWVWVLAGHHCVVALGRLLTPVCLCHQAV